MAAVRQPCQRLGAATLPGHVVSCAPLRGVGSGVRKPRRPAPSRRCAGCGYRRNRDLILRAERAGFDATLVAQHVVHPSDVEDDVLETWSTLAALAEATSRIELIGAIKPLLFNPLVFAKMAGNIADIAAAGCPSTSSVAGFCPELEALGVDLLDHDDRYVHTREWLDTVLACGPANRSPIGAGDGQPAIARPVPGPDSAGLRRRRVRARPRAGRRDGRRLLHQRQTARPRPSTVIDGPACAPGISAGRCRVAIRPVRVRRSPVTPRPRRWPSCAHLQALVDAEKRPEISGGTDPKTQMYKVLADTSRVGSNGGTLAGLVGSYDQVAERIAAFHDAGHRTVHVAVPAAGGRTRSVRRHTSFRRFR